MFFALIAENRWLKLAVASCLFAVVGCGSDEGVARYRVTGDVTYAGQPVPRGFVTFSPDAESGNSGPGGGAPIYNGKFDTNKGKGIVGGPHQVRIIGYDGVPTEMEGEELADGKPLFPPYETKLDLPSEDGTRDFVIPQ